MKAKKKDVKQVVLRLRELEFDFKAKFEELEKDEAFWTEINKIYIPEALCQIYGAIEVTGKQTIRIKGVNYEFYGYRVMEEEDLMVIYQEE